MEFTCAFEEVVRKSGFESLKAEQQQALSQFMSGKDKFVSLPNGVCMASLIYAICQVSITRSEVCTAVL